MSDRLDRRPELSAALELWERASADPIKAASALGELKVYDGALNPIAMHCLLTMRIIYELEKLKK